MTRVVLVPGALALLPEYASLTDPVAPLRAAADAAVGWLGDRVGVVAHGSGQRVAAALLGARSRAEGGDEESWLVVGNGSAKRTEKAPGHLDERAEAFDLALGDALAAPAPEALRGVDQALAAELWAETTVVPRLAELLDGARTVAVDYADDPYGVQYWVARWRS